MNAIDGRIYASNASRFSKWLFMIAAIYGVIVIFPLYFLEAKIAHDSVPFSHPVYFYGFIGVALGWQIMFFIISLNPQRYRLAMLPALLDKFGFCLPAILLYLQGRGDSSVLPFALIDGLFGILFAAAFAGTRSPPD